MVVHLTDSIKRTSILNHMYKKILSAFLIAANAVPLSIPIAALGSAIAITTVAAPAQANWFTDMFSFMPSGIYIKVDNDHRYYYGDYVRTGQPQFGEGSTWEITYNGQVYAHGYGRTPQWVWSLVNKWFSGQ
jgi:hypothetical protein